MSGVDKITSIYGFQPKKKILTRPQSVESNKS